MASPVGTGLIAYNAAISRCSRAGLHPRSLALFREMRARGLPANEYTLVPLLNSTSLLRFPTAVRGLHALLLRAGLMAHLHVANALVDAYARLPSQAAARAVFDGMPCRDVVTWTSLLTGLARVGSHPAAVAIYRDMVVAGVAPDEFAVAAALSSCAGATLLEPGRCVHATAVRLGLDPFLSVGNSLISMYAKMGSLRDAHRAFDAMRARCPITWTALIVGLARNGRGQESLAVYDQMVRAGFKPDYVTFVGLLFACSHAGLVDVGKAHFASMKAQYRITPGRDHYACMVDLLGRAGRIEEAMDLVSRRPATEVDMTVWKALLAAACRSRVRRGGGGVAIAEHAAAAVWQLDPGDAVPYVMLANLYSRARRWGDAARVRALMRARGVSKEPGRSWVFVSSGSAVHVFHAGDARHPHATEIHQKAEEMAARIRAAGHLPDTEWALQDETLEGRERGLAHHSERLAVAFMLLATPAAAPIRVFKNLRVCGDCHAALKMVAAVYGREIILRDANCFHHMKDGACSCGDYW